MLNVLRRFRVRGSGWMLSLAAVVATTIAGCNVLSLADKPRTPDAFDNIRDTDLTPRFPRQSEAVVSGAGDGSRASTYYGTAGKPVVTTQPVASGDGYELNFENTPIVTVAKVILGDILGAGYTIDARVQGTVSLASGRPVPKSDILYVLESALRLNNVAMVREARGYRLLPTAEAIGTGTVDSAGNVEPGYGITVIPLQHVSAQTLIKLLDSFATKPGAVRADTGRNLLVIQGNGTERRAAVEAALNFDADWMRGQSVGVFPVRNSMPEPLIAELEKIMDLGEGGLSQNMVKLQPIGRMNAILVVSRKPELLKTAGMWITRLDNSDTASTGVKVYRVRYGDARQIANLLTDIFTGRSAGSSFDSPMNQIAPGSGLSAVSSSTTTIATQPAAGGSIGGQPAGPVGFNQRFAAGADVPPGSSMAAAPGLGGAPSLYSRGGGGAGGATAAILPGVRITADVQNNSLLIYANQENYQIIERTLRQLDRPQLQVSIDATIAEITLNDNLSYGVQIFLKSRDVGLREDKGSVINSATATSAAISRILPGFNFLAGSEANPKVILDALQGVTDVKVLSTPSVVVIDNHVATLQVGDQIPVATRSSSSVDVPNAPVVNNIDYRNTGVILRVVPRINVNGNVLLDIEQEISNVANTANANTLTPTVSQRKIKSSIAVASGQTVLLGGLISERQDRSRTGIPGLMAIPGVGDIFARNGTSNSRTELIIFIRPQIIRDSVDAYRVASELRAKLRGSVGNLNLPPAPAPPRPPQRAQ